jgi:SNF2 family DNA or RNA helicase
MNEVIVGINKQETRLEIKSRYSQEDLPKFQSLPGRNWSQRLGANTAPATLQTARRLRELFGPRMKLTPECRQWAHRLVRKERMMNKLHLANDASLASTPRLILDAVAGKPLKLDLPPRHPFGRKRDPRPYQRADIKLMSLDNAMNCNDVGTGKTLEAIGAIYESGVYPASGIVVAPRRTLIPVWQRTFDWFTDYTFLTSDKPGERKAFMEWHAIEQRDKTVLGLIADDLRLVKYCTRKTRDEWLKENKGKQHPLHATQDYKGNWYRFQSDTHMAFCNLSYGFFIIDEFHNTGLNNRLALFHNGAKMIDAKRCWPMSATPMGGKPERLFPVLNFLWPKIYTSEWNWYEEWISIEEEEFYQSGDRGRPSGKSRKLRGLKPGIEEEFYNAHSSRMTRRRKRDALPGLPPLVDIVVETPMTKSQRRDYLAFEEDHEIVLDGKRLSGSVVLSQYLRLRQMANSRLQWDKFYTKPEASSDSGKIEWLLEALDENGLRPTTRSHDVIDPEPRARSYVGVHETSFAHVVAEEINKYGVDASVLTGMTKPDYFAKVLKRFESEDERPFVIVMTMQTGGSGLDLQQANSAHALDDPWDPDLTYQFFGRGDRGSRDTPLKCYSYVTPDSIQEYVRRVAGDKRLTNENILDFVADIEQLRKG